LFLEVDDEAWKELLEKAKDIVEDIIDDATSQPNNITFTYDAYSTTTTSLFDPSKPTEACNVITSLEYYCTGGETTTLPASRMASCACYSSSYYVPEQWNSVASRCGQYKGNCTKIFGVETDSYCDLATSYSKSANLCTSNVRHWPTKTFGEVFQNATATATTTTSGAERSASVALVFVSVALLAMFL
jgi:hypothetical protein